MGSVLNGTALRRFSLIFLDKKPDEVRFECVKKQPFLTGFPRTVFATAIRRQQARTTTNPAGEVTTTTLDRHGRPTAVQLPDNSFTYTSYHPNGQVAAKWGRLTNPTFTLYDDQGRVQELRTFANLSAEPTATTSGFAQTTWQYSPTTGLLLSKKDHLLQGASYTYTAAGRLATRTWARSTTAAPHTTEYQYSQGMLTRTDYSDTTPDVTIHYDLLGRQDSLQSAVSRTDFVYHSNTLDLDKETITHSLPGQASFTRTIDRSKDALHRATGYQVLNTNTFELGARYDYSATFGRLAKVSRLSSATTTAEEFGYGYTAQSNLIASVAGPAHTVSNTYEAQRDVLLTKANQRATDNSVISSIGYTVNNIGQRTNATRSGSATNTTAWGYDALGQVTSADDSNNNADRAYLYDTIGNRKKSADSLTLPASENYSVNALNQYTNIGGFLPTYDKDGNQLNAQIQPQASATLINAVYEWDGENRLRRVKNSAGAILVEYHYDAQSRRIATSASGTTTLYLYDGWNVIAEYQLRNATFNLHASYLWGLDLSGSMQGAGGVGGLLAVTEIPATSAPATYYPLFDGNGNITEYIDGAGSVVAQYQYDPFGNTTLTSGTKANDFAYRFSTKPLDSATGLYYYGYRYYTPQTGRWINRDPIEEQGGLNLYGFVGNDGLVKWDILGKFDGVIFYSNQKITTDVENSISSPRSIEPSKKCPEKCPEFHIEGGYSSDFKTCCSKGKMIPVVPVYTLPPYNGDYNLCINDQANKGHHFAGGKILDWVAYLSPLAYAKAGQVACASVIGLLGLPYPVDCGGRFSEMLAAETCNRKICPVEINGK